MLYWNNVILSHPGLHSSNNSLLLNKGSFLQSKTPQSKTPNLREDSYRIPPYPIYKKLIIYIINFVPDC